MSVNSQPESITNLLVLKTQQKILHWNLTKCINRIPLLTNDMSNYDEVCLFFKIKDLTEKCFDLVSQEENDKAKQLCNEQKLGPQQTLIFCNSFLENTDKVSQVKSEASAIAYFFESDQFWHNERNYLKSKGSGSSKSSSKHTSSSSASSKASV